MILYYPARDLFFHDTARVHWYVVFRATLWVLPMQKDPDGGVALMPLRRVPNPLPTS
jgi:hypothetical protein